jgi:hypothetical protein
LNAETSSRILMPTPSQVTGATMAPAAEHLTA